jgi:hypothetical protein
MERLSGRRMRLLEVVDLSDVLCRMGEFEGDLLAMPAGRETAALDGSYLVRHVGVRGIMSDRIYAGLRYELSGFVFLHHGCAPRQSHRRSETEYNHTAL